MSRFLKLILTLCSLLFLASCEEETDPAKEEKPLEDKKIPELVFTAPADGARVKGTISLSAEASDSSGIASIKILIDDELVASAADDEVAIEINTKDGSDGKKMVKFIAEDVHGNKAEETTLIEIRNTLFSVAVDDNYLGTTRIFYIVAKYDGTILGYDELEEGGSMQVETPEDYDLSQNFILHSCVYIDDPGLKLRIINSNLGFNPGAYVLKVTPVSTGQPGEHTLQVQSIPEGMNINATGTSVSGYDASITNSAFTANLRLSEQQSDLFVSSSDNNGSHKYHYSTEIFAGETTLLDHGTFIPYNTADVALGAVSDWSNTMTMVYNPNYQFSLVGNYYSSSETNAAKINFPGTTFDMYRFTITAEIQGSRYENVRIGKTPPTDFNRLGASVQNFVISSEGVAAAFSGDFDYAAIHNVTSDWTGESLVIEGFEIVFPASSSLQQFAFPQLPDDMQTFSTLDPMAKPFSSSMIVDFKEFSNINEYYQRVFFDVDPINYYDLESDNRSMTVPGQNPNGRAKTSLHNDVKVPVQASRHLRPGFSLY